jgi:centromere protein C
MAIQSLMREVKGAEFKFAKTVALPYFHSGIVDLPPGGVKRIKNSRNNHMVFWVFTGRVRVDVAGIQFSVGRGGMWQVPRGMIFIICKLL